MQLSIKQINQLITGVQLSAELPSSNKDFRRFISVAAYTHDGKVDKFINEDKKYTLYFWVRDYEFPIEYIENDWDFGDEDDICLSSFFVNEIKGIENLEKVLLEHTSELSKFIPWWETDAPM